MGASLNYLNAKSSAHTGPGTPPLWMSVIGWTIIFLFYLPACLALMHSVRRWGWTLDEWGFRLRGRSWVAIIPSLLILFLLLGRMWSVIPEIAVGSLTIGEGEFSSPFLGPDFPRLVFEGYARTAEELLYRGFALILFKRLFPRSSSRSSLWAVGLSSLLFALVHTHRPQDMPWIFISAVLLAAFTLWTHSISWAVFYHSLLGGFHIGAIYALSFFFAIAIYNEWQKGKAAVRAQQARIEGTTAGGGPK